MKKVFAAALALTMMFSLAGCSGTSGKTASASASSGVSASGGSAVKKVIVGITADPQSLSPFTAMNSGVQAVEPTLYQYLITTKGFGGSIEGVLMESYKQIDDVTYDCTIYNDIYDTAGNHMTAKDVAFSYNTAIKIGNLRTGSIKSVTATSDYTARFVFKNKLAAGGLAEIWEEVPCVTEAAYTASKDKMASTPVGTSQYKVSEYVPGSHITLVKTNDYWQKNASKILPLSEANVDTIEFEIITDSSQMTTALQTGSIDMTNSVSSNDISLFKSGGQYADKFAATPFLQNPSVVLAYNVDSSSPTSDPNLRKAIAYAVDRSGILKSVFKGDGIALTSFGNTNYADYDKSWNDGYEYNLDTAKKYLNTYLQSSGKSASGVTVNLAVMNNAFLPNVATVLQGYIQALGINCKVSTYDTATYTSKTADPKAWDLWVNMEASQGLITNVWDSMLNRNDYSWNGSINFAKDDQLQSLLETATSVSGHTPANISALNSYINNMLYMEGIVAFNSYVVSAKFVTNAAVDSRTDIMPGECTYDWSAKK